MMQTPSAIPGFVDPDLLLRLSSLDVRARCLVEGYLVGMHRSPLHGHNVEFKDHRAYEPGDEPRTVDWNVYMRTDRLYVRRREEETNMLVYVLVDAAASMDYRSPRAVMTKWEHAQSAAAALMMMLHRQQDAAALAIAGPDLPVYIRPGVKASQLHRMFAALDRKADQPAGHLASSLETLAKLVRRRSLVMVISDFYEDPQRLRGPMEYLHHMKCEPVFFHVQDPRELEFDIEGGSQLREMGTEARLSVHSDKVRKDYLAKLTRHRDELFHIAHGAGGQYVLTPTNEAPMHTLGVYLAQRSGRL